MAELDIEKLRLNHESGKYTGNELKYVQEFLDNKKIPWTIRLEKAFAERFGARYAICS